MDSWSCPAGHGLAMTLSETYGVLQDDEISTLWQTARRSPTGPLASPFDPNRAMVRFSIGYDSDEVPEGKSGDGPDEGTVELDVDVEQQFIWFDAGELERFPIDLPNAEPTAEELERLARIREQFAADVGAAMDGRDDHELSERLYQGIARRPGVVDTLDRVGRSVTSY